jgi:O-antigen ligase
MSTLSRKIGIGNVADTLFCLFLVMSFLSERTNLGRFSMFLYIARCIFMIIIRGRLIKLPFYFGLEIIFIGYCIFQNIIGVTADQSVSTDMIQTLLVNTLVYICVYNYAIFRNNFKHVLKLFLLSFMWAILINLMIDAGTLFESRSGDGIEIGGIKIGGVTPISVGWMAGICMVLATILYSKQQDKKKFWIVFILMSLALFSSGTRKAFLFVPLAMLGWFYFGQHRKNIFKLFATIIIVISICVIGYYVTINNAVLYSSVGYRLENVVMYMFSDKSDIDDASMLTRLSLIEGAKAALWQKPFMGWGLDNYRSIINNGGYYSHNNFLEILVSGGWVGFAIYYLKYIYVIVSLWLSRNYGNNRDKNWISVFLLLAITMTVLEYWQVTYYTRKFMMMWILMLVYIQSLRTVKKTKQIFN